MQRGKFIAQICFSVWTIYIAVVVYTYKKEGQFKITTPPFLGYPDFCSFLFFLLFTALTHVYPYPSPRLQTLSSFRNRIQALVLSLSSLIAQTLSSEKVLAQTAPFYVKVASPVRRQKLARPRRLRPPLKRQQQRQQRQKPLRRQQSQALASVYIL